MRKGVGNLLVLCGAAVLVVTAVSCSSVLALDPVVTSYRNADFDKAYERLALMEDEYLAKQGPLLYALDAGMLSHYSGKWDDSNRHLDLAERLIREHYTESLSANVSSYLINDLERPYQGEDYEDIYANLFKSLNYVHQGEPESALVEVRRFAEKQQLLQDSYDRLFASVEAAGRNSAHIPLDARISIRFSSSALGNWLGMVVSRDIGEKEQARFFGEQVRMAFEKQRSLYPFGLPRTVDRDEARLGDGTCRVNVIAFTGLAPVKEEVVDRFWIADNTYVKIALPRMVARPTRVASAEVLLGNGRSFLLEPIEDIGAIAMEAFRLRRSYIESKTVIRSVLKTTGTMFIDAATGSMAANANSREEANRIEFYGALFSFASRIFSEASEQADVRISHFYPDRAWVGGIDLMPGVYEARVIYRDRSGSVIGEKRLGDVVVSPRRVNLWESVWPW